MPKEERSTNTTYSDSVSINESTNIGNESASVDNDYSSEKSNLDDYTPPAQNPDSE